jgi:hypothetical protein
MVKMIKTTKQCENCGDIMKDVYISQKYCDKCRANKNNLISPYSQTQNNYTHDISRTKIIDDWEKDNSKKLNSLGWFKRSVPTEIFKVGFMIVGIISLIVVIGLLMGYINLPESFKGLLSSTCEVNQTVNVPTCPTLSCPSCNCGAVNCGTTNITILNPINSS